MQRKKGLSNFIVMDGMLRYWKAEVAAAASVPFSVILKMIYHYNFELSGNLQIFLTELTLNTALCCSVSSLKSFQESVIGEKSLLGIPSNILVIPTF